MSTPATRPKPIRARTLIVPDMDEKASDPSTYAPLDTGMEIRSFRFPVKR